MLARNFLVEKYNFVTLCTLIRYRGKKVVYLVDMVNFYPNNSLYANIYIKIGNIFFGNNHLIRFPIYSSNYDRYADVLWQSNSQALDFLQKYGETFRQTAFGQYLKNTFQDNAAFTAFKKNILENIVLKFLFYNSYTELCKDGVNLHKMISACADNHGVAEYLSFRAPNKVKSKTASLLTYFYGKLYVLFFSLFSPIRLSPLWLWSKRDMEP